MKYNYEVLDKFRFVNVEGMEWYEHQYEWFKSSMLGFGVAVLDIQFSGFYSQGDGARFTSDIELSHWIAVTGNAARFPATLWWLSKLPAGIEARTVFPHGIRHYHSHSMRVELDMNAVEQELEYVTSYLDNPVRVAVYDQMFQDLTEHELQHLERVLTDWVQEKADALYSDLEAEFEYLTSDEAIAEWLEGLPVEEQEEYCGQD